jgi:hypothetical protein
LSSIAWFRLCLAGRFPGLVFRSRFFGLSSSAILIEWSGAMIGTH